MTTPPGPLTDSPVMESKPSAALISEPLMIATPYDDELSPSIDTDALPEAVIAELFRRTPRSTRLSMQMLPTPPVFVTVLLRSSNSYSLLISIDPDVVSIALLRSCSPY